MPYSICEHERDADRDAILALWRRNFPAATPDRYDWLYRQGPATAWLLRSEENAAVGATGLMARTIRANGQTIRAAQAVDLNVDRPHRTIGPALKLQRAVTATVSQRRFDLIYAFPNSDSALIQRRVGYKPLGTFVRWVKPLRCEATSKEWFRWPRLRKIASTMLDLLLQLRCPATRYRRPRGTRVEICDRFDGRFDRLWEDVAPRFGAIGQRTSRYLTWRFCHSPAARHRILCLSDRNDCLRAYLVYSRRGGNAFISDFLFRDPADLRGLLAELVRLMRREKAEAIVTGYLGSDEIGRELARSGFLRRPSQWKALLYFDATRSGFDASSLLDHQKWHLTRADVDTDF